MLDKLMTLFKEHEVIDKLLKYYDDSSIIVISPKKKKMVIFTRNMIESNDVKHTGRLRNGLYIYHVIINDNR